MVSRYHKTIISISVRLTITSPKVSQVSKYPTVCHSKTSHSITQYNKVSHGKPVIFGVITVNNKASKGNVSLAVFKKWKLAAMWKTVII